MSDVILFGRTQTAFQTPFESEPERLNGFVSKNVQEAIEEGLTKAVSNDRFVILPSYGGNANVGRYLEIWPTLDSLSAPLSVGTSVKCLYIVSNTAAVNATCTIGFYNTVTSTLLHTTTMAAVKQAIETGTSLSPIFTLPANGALGIKIDSGSNNKPYLLIALSATL